MTPSAKEAGDTDGGAGRRRGRPTRRSGVADLTPAEIVQASLDVVRSDGLTGLTVRKVAAVLHVSPMALYQHFPDKKRLIDVVVDAVLGEVRRRPRGSEPWADWLVAQALETMRVFRLYPGTAAHTLDRGIFGHGRNSLLVADQIFAVLLDAGFDQQSALTIYTTCFCFIAGLVHTNLELPIDLSADAFPSIGALAPHAVESLQPETIAEYGLRCLLAGVAARPLTGKP
jgi:AcrR family transcriptional regulator